MWVETKLDSLLRYFRLTLCKSFSPKDVAVLLGNCREGSPRDELAAEENRVRTFALESALGVLTDKVDSLEALLLQTQRDLTELELTVGVDR